MAYEKALKSIDLLLFYPFNYFSIGVPMVMVIKEGKSAILVVDSVNVNPTYECTLIPGTMRTNEILPCCECIATTIRTIKVNQISSHNSLETFMLNYKIILTSQSILPRTTTFPHLNRFMVHVWPLFHQCNQQLWYSGGEEGEQSRLLFCVLGKCFIVKKYSQHTIILVYTTACCVVS